MEGVIRQPSLNIYSPCFHRGLAKAGLRGHLAKNVHLTNSTKQQLVHHHEKPAECDVQQACYFWRKTLGTHEFV